MEKAGAPIDSLPDNILLDILSYLSVKDRCVSGRVCRRWRKIVQDNSLWRYVDLLPYQVELKKLWKLVRAHLSDRLRVLRVRGVLDTKTHEVKPPLSESMLEEVRTRCPKLWWLHMEPASITNLPSPTLLPPTLTHLTLRRCTWTPRWLRGADQHLPHLVYLDLSDTVRVDNHDMKDVAQFTNLHTLKLDNCYRLTDPGLQDLATSLTKLTALSLQGCSTTTLVMHFIARHLTRLEELDLSRSPGLCDSFLAELQGLNSLKRLRLDQCENLTGGALAVVLGNCSNLRTLSMVLREKPVAEEDVKPWRDKMPLCSIVI